MAHSPLYFAFVKYFSLHTIMHHNSRRSTSVTVDEDAVISDVVKRREGLKRSVKMKSVVTLNAKRRCSEIQKSATNLIAVAMIQKMTNSILQVTRRGKLYIPRSGLV